MSSNGDRQSATAYDEAYSKLCHFAALNASGSPNEVIDHLVEQTMYLSDTPRSMSADETRAQATECFSLDFAQSEIEDALGRLQTRGGLVASSGKYSLTPSRAAEIESSLNKSQSLAETVKTQWQQNLRKSLSSLSDADVDVLWDALQRYLAATFKRHGVQTILLFEPDRKRWSGVSAKSLSTILDEALKRVPHDLKKIASNELPRFLAPETPERTEYLAQLLDRTFTFFALTLEDKAASVLRASMPRLTLLLDTNFLFGLLDLHSGPFVQVSKELIQLVRNHNLPIALRYAPPTRDELRRTLEATRRNLGGRTWKPSISRAAITCYDLAGIEMRFHEMNVGSPLDVETFFGKYRNFALLLKEKGIDVYNTDMSSVEQDSRSADDDSKYEKFLKVRFTKKHKPPEAISHDVLVRRLVMNLRGRAENFFEAGAFLVTCDYTLLRFDQSQGPPDRIDVCILPNQLLQALRPFVPRTKDFDRSFVETFRMPEFRAIGSQRSRACSKVLAHLNSYKDLSEKTAVAVLANNVLRARLEDVKEESKELAEIIDSTVAQENARLQAEAERLAEEKEALGKEKGRLEKELQQSVATLAGKEERLLAELSSVKEELDASEAERKQLERGVEKETTGARGLRERVQRQEDRLQLQGSILRWIIVAATVTVLSFLWLVLPWIVSWQWLVRHSRYLLVSIFGELLAISVTLLIALHRHWKVFLPLAVTLAIVLASAAFG